MCRSHFKLFNKTKTDKAERIASSQPDRYQKRENILAVFLAAYNVKNCWPNRPQQFSAFISTSRTITYLNTLFYYMHQLRQNNQRCLKLDRIVSVGFASIEPPFVCMPTWFRTQKTNHWCWHLTTSLEISITLCSAESVVNCHKKSISFISKTN